MIELISKGGAFMWPLLVLAFVAMFLIVERVLFFQRVRIDVGDMLIGLANLVRKGKHDEALHEAARAPGPVPRVAHAALMRHKMDRKDLRDVVQEAGQLEVPGIERNLRGVYAIALIAPLLGVLGTINGLIRTFQGISKAGGTLASTEQIYEGFYESLVTTGIGLAIAVPCYLFYLHFVGRSKRLIHRIERAGIEVVNIISDAREGITTHLVTKDKKPDNKTKSSAKTSKSAAKK